MIKKKEMEKLRFGKFKLGVVFGVYDKEIVKLDNSLDYIKINDDLFWVDDINSKYYNQLVDVKKIDVDWKSAECLSNYSVQYEYAIEIKTNPQNIPGKGSAIFIHCSNGEKTAGCIALEREKMIELLEKINQNTMVIIK